jgi:hypothetical protein
MYCTTAEERKTELARTRIDPWTFHEYSIRYGQIPACIENELREVRTAGHTEGETLRACALKLLLPY